MNYYKKNLNKLGDIKLKDSIKIKLEGKETNYFAINKESIKELKEWEESRKNYEIWKLK